MRKNAKMQFKRDLKSQIDLTDLENDLLSNEEFDGEIDHIKSVLL